MTATSSVFVVFRIIQTVSFPFSLKAQGKEPSDTHHELVYLISAYTRDPIIVDQPDLWLMLQDCELVVCE